MIFCDFDGTVTDFETAEGLWEYLLGDTFHKKMKQLLKDNANTSHGIKELFSLVPSADYPLIEQYILSIKLRPGFPEFLQWIATKDIPFVLVSAGIREMIDAVLEPYENLITAVHCCDLDYSGPFLTISCPYDNGIDLMQKEAVMKQYYYKKSIYIGDSFTDMNAARTADSVFARDRLHTYLSGNQIPHYTFETFHDIRNIMENIFVI